jgi:membrane protein implicated in regulation of membrane protease activity
MTWWGWMIGGAILLGAELLFVSAEFYLVFIGSAAIAVGLLTLAAAVAPWAQWALFAVLAIGSMVTFRARLYRRFHHGLPKVTTGPVGGVLKLPVSLAAGESCQAEYGGSFWTVQNDSEQAIASGSRARVVGVRDLTLLVRPDT